MKNTGMYRSLDSVGRVVIPCEIREMLNWNVADKIDIYVTDDGIFLKKQESKCAECNDTTSELVSLGGREFCKMCLRIAGR